MTTTTTKRFEIGKTYSMRSICDQDCVWTYTVIKRTASTVTLKDEDGKVKTCRISKLGLKIFNEESCQPLGNYSMAPTLRA